MALATSPSISRHSGQIVVALRSRVCRAVTLRLLVIAIVCGFFAGLTNPLTVAAQGGGWTPPAILPMLEEPPEELSNLGTSLVVDTTGIAHLMWRGHPRSTGPNGFLYYYSRWNGQSWSKAIDVFAASAGVALSAPVLVASPDGRLHLFWAIPNGILRSWSWSTSAPSAKAWAASELVIGDPSSKIADMDVELDSTGIFHIVYAVNGDSVHYVQSVDDGVTWTNPSAVSQIAYGLSSWRPKLDVGGDGRIHVIWTEYTPEAGFYQSVGVYYAQSVDSGATWSDPHQAGGFAHSDGNVLASDDGTVFLAWNGGVAAAGGRFLQVSRDGALTWDPPVQFSRWVGQAGYPSMVVDSQGVLHILETGGGYSIWDKGRLLPEQMIYDPPNQAEDSRLALLNGNQLMAVLVPYGGRLYYTTRFLPLPAIPTVLPPIHALTPTPITGNQESASPAVTALAAALTPTTSLTALVSTQPDLQSASSVAPLITSFGLTVALLAGVMVVQLRKRRK